MNTITVGELQRWMNAWAPFDTAEAWDNTGLLIGSEDIPVTGVVTCLDITPAVVEQAAQLGANLLISHHPVLFNAIKSLRAEDVPYLLARHGMSAIAAHTNLDKAAGGLNDLLCLRLQLQDVRIAEDGLCRIGRLPSPMMPRELGAYIANTLGLPAGGLQGICGEAVVETLAVCTGAAGEFAAAMLTKADAYLTGELHYHEWPFTKRTLFAAGHFHTEIGIAEEIAHRLRVDFPALPVYAAQETCPYDVF